jgi:thiamine biosynthesis lipoprotein
MTVAPPATAGPVIVRLAAAAMATRFEIVLGGEDEVGLRAAGEAALAEIRACEQAISPFLAGSSIARINREAGTRPVRVDPLTFELLEDCVRLVRATGSAFDPTVGAAMRALGFRGSTRDERAGEAARAAIGMDRVELDPERRTVRFKAAGLEFDVGAIGKGHALDLAAACLREAGVRCALLHGGTSTAIAIGAPPGQDGFRIAIGPEPRAPVAVIRDAALSVSSILGRRLDDGTPHIVDPRCGRPAQGRATTAAAITRHARTADAWSTALLVRDSLDLVDPDDSALILRGGIGLSFRNAAGPNRFEIPALSHPTTFLP